VELAPVEHTPVEHITVELAPVEHTPVEHTPVEHCSRLHTKIRPKPRSQILNCAGSVWQWQMHYFTVSITSLKRSIVEA
jgi:hypothetical protein